MYPTQNKHATMESTVTNLLQCHKSMTKTACTHYTVQWRTPDNWVTGKSSPNVSSLLIYISFLTEFFKLTFAFFTNFLITTAHRTYLFLICVYWFQLVLHHLGIPRDIYRGCTIDPNYQFTFKVLSQYLDGTFWSVHSFIHSFSVLSDDRSKASSKTLPPHSVI